MQYIAWFFFKVCAFFFQRPMYDIVYVQNAGDDSVCLVFCTYTYLCYEKKCAMHFLPWEIIFMWSIYRDWVYHNLF